MSALMTAPPPAPVLPAVAGPQPYRWTISEYRLLAKTGLFEDRKTMLLDGELYVMVMPHPPHDVSLGLAEEWVRLICPAGHHVRAQKGFNVGTRNDPGPDLVIVPGSIRDYARESPSRALLAVEVADSSLFLDTTKKAELYATAGVPDYWVIEVENRRLHVFRDPAPLPAGLGATAYRTHTTHGPDESVAPLLNPAAAVKVADLLP
ncbi:MAG: Uma2 family endonuclease [Gemmataceae bacterium]|nr:Uma2 family endonuclease [Gemmataceae bacterium]